jgi:hypothetical protein
MISKNIGSFPV